MKKPNHTDETLYRRETQFHNPSAYLLNRDIGEAMTHRISNDQIDSTIDDIYSVNLSDFEKPLGRLVMTILIEALFKRQCAQFNLLLEQTDSS